MQGEYRDANSLREIDSILAHATSEGCLVWQNLTGKRNVYNVKTVEYDSENKLSKIFLKQFKNDFDKESFVYIKFDYRETMLKAKIERISGNWLYVRYPDKDNIKTKELRREDRQAFDPSEDIFVRIKIKSLDKNSTDHHLKFQLLDVAEGGISLLVSNFNKTFVENASHMILTHIGELKLDKAIQVDIRYIQNFRYKVRGKNHFSNRAGFKLNEKFDMAELQEFLNKSKAS